MPRIQRATTHACRSSPGVWIVLPSITARPPMSTTRSVITKAAWLRMRSISTRAQMCAACASFLFTAAPTRSPQMFTRMQPPMTDRVSLSFRAAPIRRKPITTPPQLLTMDCVSRFLGALTSLPQITSLLTTGMMVRARMVAALTPQKQITTPPRLSMTGHATTLQDGVGSYNPQPATTQVLQTLAPQDHACTWCWVALTRQQSISSWRQRLSL